jgi:hypothetical protein
MANLIIINVVTSAGTKQHPIEAGTLPSNLLADSDFREGFQLPGNVEPVVNGVKGNIPLSNGDTLSFQTVASSKAAARGKKTETPKVIEVEAQAMKPKKAAKAKKPTAKKA